MTVFSIVIDFGNLNIFSASTKKNNFFLIGIRSMQGRTATIRHGVTRKRSTKRLKHTGNLFRKNLQLKDVLILDLKPLRS